MTSTSRTNRFSDQTNQSVDLLGNECLKEFNIKSAHERKQERNIQAACQVNGGSEFNHDRTTFGPKKIAIDIGGD